MDTVLASEKRCDDKRCGRAASRCRAGCETTYKIGKQKRKQYDTKDTFGGSGNDTHIDVPDTAVRPGHILCEDGTALPYAQYEQSGKKAIAVVFDTEKRGDTEGDGYAVYLWDIAPQAFADSLGIAQGTSADIMAYDGNENTFALYDTQETASPMAEAVFDLWRYGQSAYVPSVAEMRLLYTMRKIINPVIEQCGGEPLPLDENDCWYWTSTEVEKQQTAKAWLYSMGSGAMQETPKVQAHKVRPIITINE